MISDNIYIKNHSSFYLIYAYIVSSIQLILKMLSFSQLNEVMVSAWQRKYIVLVYYLASKDIFCAAQLFLRG